MSLPSCVRVPVEPTRNHYVVTRGCNLKVTPTIPLFIVGLCTVIMCVRSKTNAHAYVREQPIGKKAIHRVQLVVCSAGKRNFVVLQPIPCDIANIRVFNAFPVNEADSWIIFVKTQTKANP